MASTRCGFVGSPADFFFEVLPAGRTGAGFARVFTACGTFFLVAGFFCKRAVGTSLSNPIQHLLLRHAGRGKDRISWNEAICLFISFSLGVSFAGAVRLAAAGSVSIANFSGHSFGHRFLLLLSTILAKTGRNCVPVTFSEDSRIDRYTADRPHPNAR